jgi:hypothetical protein
MEQAEERYYLIGLGSAEDWKAGRGSPTLLSGVAARSGC